MKKNKKSSKSYFSAGFSNKKDPRNNILKKDFNLLPKDILEQRRFDEKFKQIYFLFLKVIILASALLIIPYTMILTLNLDKNELNKKIDSISKIEDVETNVINSQALLKKQQNIILSINRNDSVISVVLTAIEKVIPKSMYLTSLSQETVETKDASNKKATTQKVLKITGFAKDKESVADFQKSLKASNMYQSVFVNKIEEKDVKQEKVTKTTQANGLGELIESEIRLNLGFKVTVEFEMECILNEWK